MGGWSERVMGQTGFFDVERRLEAISALGDPLETIKKIVPWEDFRTDIEAVTETKPEERKSNAGRKPYDTILKFKIMVLQSLHNLSDDRTEYLIRDRISFMRFLDLELEEPVPDATTIWLFREALAQAGLIESCLSASASILRLKAILRAAARSLTPRLCRCPSSATRRRRTRRSRPARRPRDGSSSPPRMPRRTRTRAGRRRAMRASSATRTTSAWTKRTSWSANGMRRTRPCTTVRS